MFAAPASVGAGQQYALLLTRPGAAQFALHDRDGNPCPGQEFFSLSQSGPWTPNSPSYDAVFAVFVKPSNAFTLGEITRNKKKGTATITGNVPNPGQLSASGKPASAPRRLAVISKAVAPGTASLLDQGERGRRSASSTTPAWSSCNADDHLHPDGRRSEHPVAEEAEAEEARGRSGRSPSAESGRPGSGPVTFSGSQGAVAGVHPERCCLARWSKPVEGTTGEGRDFRQSNSTHAVRSCRNSRRSGELPPAWSLAVSAPGGPPVGV